jgi:hypothetical protein
MNSAHARRTHADLARELEAAVAAVAAAMRDIPAQRLDLQTRANVLTADSARSRATGVALNNGAALQARRAELALEALALQDRCNAASGAAFLAASNVALRALAMLAQAAQAIEDIETGEAEREAAAAAQSAAQARAEPPGPSVARASIEAARIAAGLPAWDGSS